MPWLWVRASPRATLLPVFFGYSISMRVKCYQLGEWNAFLTTSSWGNEGNWLAVWCPQWATKIRLTYTSIQIAENMPCRLTISHEHISSINISSIIMDWTYWNSCISMKEHGLQFKINRKFFVFHARKFGWLLKIHWNILLGIFTF